MELVNVEGVEFAGSILDDPVFDCALGGDDVRRVRVHVECFGLLAVDGEVELDCTGGIVGIA